jgi:hypothetical protein
VRGLVSGYEAAMSAGRVITVINGRGPVQQVFDITGLSEVLCALDSRVSRPGRPTPDRKRALRIRGRDSADIPLQLI